MTRQKQLKSRIRARMARTGESYTTARRHVAGDTAPRPTGPAPAQGRHPVSAALAGVLAHHGVRAAGAPLSEELLFGPAGGPGAGYILWEFAHDGSRPVVLGFSSEWQYHDRAPLAALRRLGVPARVSRTAGAVGASRALADTVAAGRPALVWPDRYRIGLWHLPSGYDGAGGHPVAVHARTGAGYAVHDRGPSPFTVPAADLDDARARVGSYRNLLVVPDPDRAEIPGHVLRDGLLDGWHDAVERLARPSTSFSLPAWHKWARLVTDRGAAKGWPAVFADGRGLTGALASIWEGASPAGMTGGNLRDLTADALEAAAPVLDLDLTGPAEGWRAAAAAWTAVADAALPADVPEFARLRELTAGLYGAVLADGDAGRADAAATAAELWALRAGLDARPPLSTGERDDLFAALAAALHAVHAAEVDAHRRLRHALAARPRPDLTGTPAVASGPG